MLIFFIAVVLYQSMGDFIEIYFKAWRQAGCSRVQRMQVYRQRVPIPPATHFMVCACEKFFNHQRTSAIMGGKNAKKIIQESDRGKCDP
jgi:hypothetical protein